MKKKIAISCIALMCASMVLSACASGGNSSEPKNGKVKVDRKSGSAGKPVHQAVTAVSLRMVKLRLDLLPGMLRKI